MALPISPLLVGRLLFLLELHRLLEALLLRLIDFCLRGIALGSGGTLTGHDSVHGSLDPDLLTELFLFLFFVVVTQGSL